MSTYFNDRSEHRVIANRENRRILRRNGIKFATVTDTSEFPNFKGRRVLLFTTKWDQRDKDHELQTVGVPMASGGKLCFKGCPIQYTKHLSD